MSIEAALEILITVLWILAASFLAAGAFSLVALIWMHIRKK